jgi:phosphatidylglycerophosphatase A
MVEVVLVGLSEWFIQLLAFILFRIFDIFKPQPISWIDKHIKGGVGIMLDDLVAAGFTLLIIALSLKVYTSEIFL